MMKNTTIGEKIKRIRLDKNMSQERFGTKIGVSGKSISAYENNICTPSLKVMETISFTYGVTFLAEKNKNTLSKKIQDLKECLLDLENILDNTLSL